MTVEQGVEAWDQFPVGMRVLAVDDDQTCLRIIENLLHHCQYHVTTTNQAQTALELLRDHKNKFDLVISDVDMPDMDGFKLLEHVGLEMDLPVIMLSAHSDPKYVMKGITHGACDYLLKPVRIEELKNIWQHVIRRRRFDNKSRGNNSQNKDGSGNVNGNEAAGNSDQNGAKANRKRKDQYEEEEEETEDGHENDDPSTQKKPRVVWSVELHRKFVAAVNQLGIEKAVPKKILDLMNVEKLTRENVASHLQKYRLYLKRISCVANQQANMAAVLGSSDPHYLQMGSSLNGLGGFHRSMAVGSAQFPGGAALRSFPSNGILGRLNSPAGLGIRGLSSSGMFLQNPTDVGKFQQVSSLPVNHSAGGNILHGLPMPLELDQLQTNNSSNNKCVSGNAGYSGFSTQNPLIGGGPNNLIVLEGHPQQPSPSGTSVNSGFSSHFSGDQSNRRLEHWSGAVSSTLPPGNIAPNVVSTMPSGNSNHQFDVSSLSSSGPVHLQHSKPDTQEWGIHNSSMNYSIPLCDASGPLNQNLDPNSTTLSRNTDFDSNGQLGFLDPLQMKQADLVCPTTDALLSNNMKEGLIRGQQRRQNSFMGADAGSLDDIVNSVMKQEQSQTDLSGGDLGFAGFSSLRTCI